MRPKPIGPFVVALLVALAVGPEAMAQKKAPGGARVLILSGGQREHHGYREQALYLSRLLEDTGSFQATIVEDASIVETPAMTKYDALILTADRRDPEFKFTLGQQRAILGYVKAGHGFASVHAADNAAPDWLPEWKAMLGGVYSHVGLPDGKAIKGTYRVKIPRSDHPVTAGLADFDLKDELYANMQMMPDVEPLATVAYQGKDWPVAWVYRFGEGKVLHVSLGHRDFGPDKPDPLADPNLAKLILQGITYATTKADGKPR